MSLQFKTYSSYIFYSIRVKASILLLLVVTVAFSFLVAVLTDIQAYAYEYQIESQYYNLETSEDFVLSSQSFPKTALFHEVKTEPLGELRAVTIKTSFEENTFLTNKKRVSDILREFGYDKFIDKDDFVVPSMDSLLVNTNKIKIFKVSKMCEDKFIKIPFKTEVVKDNEMFKGTKEVVKQGREGKELVTICTIYIDGQKQSNSEITKQLIIGPTTQKVKIGTKDRYEKLYQSASCSYWDKKVDEKIKDPRLNQWFKDVMRCESHCNPQANNSNMYLGLMQFSSATFRSYGGQNIWDGEDQIDAVLKMYNAKNKSIKAISYQWPHCAAKYR